MKQLFSLLVVFCWLGLTPMLVNAQSGKVCNEKGGLSWEMNIEPDMKEYHVYHGTFANLQKGSVGVEVITIAHDPSAAVDNGDGTKTVIHRHAALPEGQRYFKVSALDQAGNESDLSIEVDCKLDFSPATPNLELRMTFEALPEPPPAPTE